MATTKNEFMELVGEENIGFTCHMFLDGVEYALGAISPKPVPIKALSKAVNAMMATMCGKKLITEDEWRGAHLNHDELYMISLDKD